MKLINSETKNSSTMKNKAMLLLALVAAFSLSNCESRTVIVEVPPKPPVVKPAPKPAPKPKPPPTPSEFKVVNQYDSDAR